MPDPKPVPQQGLPLGPEQNQTLSQQPSQRPLHVRFDGANRPNQECLMRWS